MVFTPVGDALQDKMGKNKSLKDQLETAHIIAATEKVFSEHFSGEDSLHVKPLFVKNRTLTVTCSSAAVAQEIRMNQAKVVKKINEEIGNKEIDRIRYLS
tara:strand:+ start:284 stop:583 length:300 start_codon:yes stop_codon:yes gene_type:complete